MSIMKDRGKNMGNTENRQCQNHPAFISEGNEEIKLGILDPEEHRDKKP